MNNINLIGRLTADPELKTTSSGVSVCAFTLAVKRPHTSDKTDFVNCVAWRNTAEFLTRYFTKGKMIALSGYLSSRNFEDKNGKKHTVHEVIVENTEFCGDKKLDENATANPVDYSNVNLEDVTNDDELPF